MSKIVVSAEEVASVAPEPAPGEGRAREPQYLPAGLKYGLPVLVLVLPVLCLATICVWLYARTKEPRVQVACMRYCCGLLVVSGLLTSLLVGIWLLLLLRTGPREVIGSMRPLTISLSPIAQGGTETLSPRELAVRTAGQVFIVSRERKGTPPTIDNVGYLGFGTAVLISASKDDYLFVTSRHVLDGENWEHAAPYQGNAVLLDREGGAATAEIVGRHKKLDLMLMRMPRTKEGELFSQAIQDFDQIEAGERIMIFGHPQGLFFSLADGLVSRTDDVGVIQITAPVSPGASGGPVFDFRGRLLGIVTSMFDKRRSPYAENLNFAARADSILHPDQWEVKDGDRKLLEAFAASFTTPASGPPPATTTSSQR